MSNNLHLTWIHEPKHLAPPPDGTMMTSGPESYARFIQAIERHAGVRVHVLEGLLRDVAPPEGFILLWPRRDPRASLAACDVDRRSDLASRLVPVFSASPVRVVEGAAEALAVAALVSSECVDQWQAAPAPEHRAAGLYGLCEIARRVGAACLPSSSARYGHLTSSSHDGLPHLLADYLGALLASGSHVGPRLATA